MFILQQRADAGRVWFKRLSPRHRQIVIASGLIALGLLVFGLARWHHHSQPGYVLEVLDRINFPADVQRESGYLTPQGKDLLVWLFERRGDKPPSIDKPSYAKPIVYGNECRISIQGREGSGIILLRCSDHWRFDDMYLDTYGGEQFGIWLSDLKAHPFQSVWKGHWKQLLLAVLKGFIGAGAVR